MKATLAVFALFILVLSSIGVARLPWKDILEGRVGRPNMGRTPPGAIPLPRAVRQQTLRSLEEKRWDELTRSFEETVEQATNDPRLETQATLLVDAFDTANPAVTPPLDLWVAAKPESFAPYLARARHRYALAYHARGSKAASKTSTEQLERMNQLMVGVLTDSKAALDRRPELAEAHARLIAVAMTTGNAQDCITIGRTGLEHVPASRRIRLAVMRCLMPRWGGSSEAIDMVAREAAPHFEKNPALASLDGFSDWDHADMLSLQGHDDQAQPYLDRAIAAGDDANFYESRALLNWRAKRMPEALADIERALDLSPENPTFLVERASLLGELGRQKESVTDIAVVRELDPTNEKLKGFDHTELNAATTEAYELIQANKKVDGAIARIDAALEHTGPMPQALFWRGRAHIINGDHKRALADIDAAIKADPRYYDAYATADWLLMKDRDWTGIIRRWDRFIALEPNNAKALLERAGAHKHAGHMKSAKADLVKACKLGLEKACGYVNEL